jgi:hypothetical protein
VVFSRASSAGFALDVVILMVLSSMSVSGLSAWNETAPDFQNGQMAGTKVEGSDLTLDPAGQGASWTKVGNESFPPGRYMNTMTYDSNDNIHIMWGGESGVAYDNRTWTYDALADRWEVHPSPDAPHSRRSPRLAFDQRHGEVVLFGS